MLCPSDLFELFKTTFGRMSLDVTPIFFSIDIKRYNFTTADAWVYIYNILLVCYYILDLPISLASSFCAMSPTLLLVTPGTLRHCCGPFCRCGSPGFWTRLWGETEGRQCCWLTPCLLKFHVNFEGYITSTLQNDKNCWRPSGMASQGQSTHLGKAHRSCDLGFGPQRLAASCVEDEN